MISGKETPIRAGLDTTVHHKDGHERNGVMKNQRRTIIEAGMPERSMYQR